MKIERIERDWYNKLLNRRDLELILTYEYSTPKREEIKSIFGSQKARIHAHIYDDVEYAKRFERKNVLKKHALISMEGEKVGKTS